MLWFYSVLVRGFINLKHYKTITLKHFYEMQTDLIHTNKDAAQAEAGRVMLPVEGMECAACAVRIERQLAKVPGVREAVVNYATGEAAVAYEPGGGDLATFVRTVEKAGYGVRTETLALPRPWHS